MVLCKQSSGKIRTCMAVCAVNLATFTVWAFVTQLSHEQLRQSSYYSESQNEGARQMVSMLWIFGAAFFLSFCWCCCCCCCCCGFSNLDKRFSAANEDQLELRQVIFTVQNGSQDARISFPPPPPRYSPFVPPGNSVSSDERTLNNNEYPQLSSRLSENFSIRPSIPPIPGTPPPSYEEAMSTYATQV